MRRPPGGLARTAGYRPDDDRGGRSQPEAAQAPVAAEEGGDVQVRGRREQRVRIGELGDPAALAQHDHLVAEPDRLLDVVGDEQHRLVQLGLEAEQLLLQPGADHRVDGAERLVHQQHRRVGGQGPRDTHALLLPAGELERVPLGGLGCQSHQVEQFGRPGAGLLPVPAEQIGNRRDVVDHPPVREQPGLLDHVADAAPKLGRVQLRHIGAVQQDPPRGRFDHAVDHPQQRGLPAAGRADQHGRPTGGDVEVEALDGDRAVGVALARAFESDHGEFPRLGGPRWRRRWWCLSLCRSVGLSLCRVAVLCRAVSLCLSVAWSARLRTGGNSDQPMTW